MFFYAGAVHAQTAYADAAFNPPEPQPSNVQPQSTTMVEDSGEMPQISGNIQGGYHSAEYQQAVADLGEWW
jgi:hypothetical protein